MTRPLPVVLRRHPRASLLLAGLVLLGACLSGRSASAAFAPDTNWASVEAWAEGGTVGSGPTAYGTREPAAGNGLHSGPGVQSHLVDKYHYLQPPHIGTTIAGYASARVALTVDPEARTASFATDLHNFGRGPTTVRVNFLGQMLDLPWSAFGDWFGAGISRGYFANAYRIDPGVTGLDVGVPVQVVVSIQLQGSVATTLDNVPRADSLVSLYTGLQAFRVTDAGLFGFDGSQRVVNWFNRETEMHLGYVTPGLASTAGYQNQILAPGPTGGNGPVSLNSGDLVIQAFVGDTIFVENYYEMVAKLPTHGGTSAEYRLEADFAHTLSSPLTPGAGYAGLEINPVDLRVVPEPAGFALGCLASMGLLACRLRRAPL